MTKETLPAIPVDPKEYGIEKKQALDLYGNLPQIKLEREAFEKQYQEVLTMDIEDPITAKVARELRLKIKNNRTQGINTWHKTAKDFFLKGGQFVDAIKKMEVNVNETMETRLEEIEKNAEIQEMKRKEELRQSRSASLEPYKDFVPFGLDLGGMPEEEFAKVLNGAKLQFDAKQEQERKEQEERERKAEIDRLHSERHQQALPLFQFWNESDKFVNFGELTEEAYQTFIQRCQNAKLKFDKEQELLRLENERLQREKEEAEEKAKIEREKREKEEARQRAEQEKIRLQNEEKARKEREEYERELKAERERSEKVQAELKRKQEEEERIAREKAEAEAKSKKEAEELAKAPIKNQMNAWVQSFQLPTINLENETKTEIEKKFEGFKNWAIQEIQKL